MGYENTPLIAFNRGILSPLGLARVDLKRTALSAETMTNWMPRVLGSMMLRPGLAYTAATYLNKKSVTIPFIFSGTDLARLELTDQILRPLISDQPISRVSVSTAISNGALSAYVTNGTFDADASWTKGAGWTIGAGVATATGAISTAISQTCPVTIIAGKSYSVTMTITRAAGTLTPSVGGTAGTARNAAGTYTETIVAGATQTVAFTGAGFTGTLDTVTIEPTDNGWVDTDEVGATSTVSAGVLNLVGTGFAAAIREQHITVSGGDQNKEHALRIVVSRGPVVLRVGSASGGDQYIGSTTLGTGTHSLAFTPTGADAYIRFSSLSIASKKVTSCTMEAAGVVTLPAPWLEADLPSVRWDASADVTYVDCYGYQQRKIERRSTTSWSVVLYEPIDGPFRVQNTGVTTITPSAINGDITLVSSRNIFKSTHVGALFKMTSIGQVVDASFTADNQFSNPIKVTGTGTQRTFNISISNTFVATLQLQMSVGDVGAWVDVTGKTYTVPTTTTYTDGLAGQTIYYRLGIKTGAYTSGQADIELTFSSGSLDGIVKITAYTDEKNVSAAVLQSLGSLTGTSVWKEGEWSDYRGWPSEVKLVSGRLCHFGKSKVWGSISDAYESFDETVIGDSAAINRSFGKGPVDRVQWALPLQRLLIGGQIAEWSVHTTSLDDPLTNNNFNTKSPSSQGAANVPAVQVDSRALFVEKSGYKLYQMSISQDSGYIFDYESQCLSEISPEVTKPAIVKIIVQRQPDTRVHCIRSDGKVGVLVSQPAEDVMCWLLIDVGGVVEDGCVMPGTTEDSVYYQVKRTVNGSDVRYHEKWALEDDCQGGTLNKQADSFVTYTGAPSTTITAAHLKGETCVLWGDGKALGSAVANSGTGVITLPNSASASNIVAGLGYTADFKSSKLAYAAQLGTALTMKKRISHLSVMLYNTHYQGLKYGRDFTHLEPLPLSKQGATIAADTIFANYDMEPIAFPGTWDTDARLCLRATAPYPCTVLGAVIGLSTSG